MVGASRAEPIKNAGSGRPHHLRDTHVRRRRLRRRGGDRSRCPRVDDGVRAFSMRDLAGWWCGQRPDLLVLGVVAVVCSLVGRRYEILR